MAATTIAIQIMKVSKIIFQSLFSFVNEKSSFLQLVSILHAVMFSHPHGITSTISSKILTSIAKKVKEAHKKPTFPILSAIVPSFC